MSTYRHAFTGILIHTYDLRSFDLVGDRETGLTPRGVYLLYIYIHICIYIFLLTYIYILVYFYIYIINWHSFDLFGDREMGLTLKGDPLFIFLHKDIDIHIYKPTHIQIYVYTSTYMQFALVRPRRRPDNGLDAER